jgi:hypothetical protein
MMMCHPCCLKLVILRIHLGSGQDGASAGMHKCVCVNVRFLHVMCDDAVFSFALF